MDVWILKGNDSLTYYGYLRAVAGAHAFMGTTLPTNKSMAVGMKFSLGSCSHSLFAIPRLAVPGLAVPCHALPCPTSYFGNRLRSFPAFPRPTAPYPDMPYPDMPNLVLW